ncbi:MAG: hypothetical protein NVS4B11_01840 [Ktedonobacteraceae bacterium]
MTEIVGEANTREGAVRLAPSLVPDVIVMDFTMPGMKSGGTWKTRLRKHNERLHNPI